MATLRKLGNSTGIIIPDAALNVAGFKLGDELDIGAEEGRISIKKTHPFYSLDQLLEGITPDMMSRDKDDEWLNSTIGKEIILPD